VAQQDRIWTSIGCRDTGTVTAPVEAVPSSWVTTAFGSVAIGPGLTGAGLFEYSTRGADAPASVASMTTDRSCCAVVEVLAIMVRSWSARIRDQASTPPLSGENPKWT